MSCQVGDDGADLGREGNVDANLEFAALTSRSVGLDGFGSSTVEQVGTSVDCSSGRPVYYAWYEMYPRRPPFLPVRIWPGNHIAASVTHTRGGRFALFLRNLPLYRPLPPPALHGSHRP